MKKVFKFITAIILVIVNTNLFFAQDSENGFKCTGGVYYTYEDFLNGKIEDLGILETHLADRVAANVKEITFMKPDPTMTVGPKHYTFKLKEKKIWGFRTTDGSIYRFYEGKSIYNLLVSGPFSLWVSDDAKVGRDEKGNPNWVQMPDFHYFISKGPNSEVYELSNKNAKEVFPEETEMLSKIKSLLKSEDFRASSNKLINLCFEYNSRHAK